jgi:hypothetical protein
MNLAPSSAMRPDELETVQHVFRDISSQDWFSRDPERLQKFAAFLIRAYQGGMVDRVILHDLALRTARERFVDESTNY